jgi:4-amino-4-deoxy-L-arabinose transferase-like glycosyltransferase
VTDLPEPARDKSRLPLLILLALAFAIRVGWGLTRPTDPAAIEQLPDQREYLELADNLLHAHGLFFYDPRFTADVFAYRTPGYPAFLALCGANVRAARVAQALVDTSTVLAVYLLTRRWFTRRRSLVAATLIALNPFLIYFSALILSETLFTAMLAWGLVLLICSSPRPLLATLLLALSILVRPSAAGLPVLLGIVAAVLNRDRRGAYPQWWPLPPATTSLVITILVLLPWGYRNYKVLGHWVWMTTNGGITAYDGLNDDATGASDQRFVTRTPVVVQASEVQRDQYFAEAAREWARQHPRRVWDLALAKIARTWSPVPLSAEYGRPLYRWIGGLYAIPLDLLVILGLIYGRLPRAAKVLLVLPAIYFTLIHAATVGSLRYRLPVEPPMAVLAVASAPVLAAGKERYLRARDSGNARQDDE